MSLMLHPKKGVNPKLTFCPRCGGEANELVLVGQCDFKNTCQTCGMVHYGGGNPPHRKLCSRPDCSGFLGERVALEEHEKLPASRPCKSCRELLEVAEEAFKTGGVLFICKPCGEAGVRHEGVIAGHSKVAKYAREKMGLEAPAPCGIELPDCPEPKKTANA